MMLPLFALIAAQSDPLAPLPQTPPAVLQTPALQVPPPPVVVTAPLVVPRDWRGVLAAIRGQDWAGAAAGIAALPDDPLKNVAKAELYTARYSPTASVGDLQALLAEAPDLPQAEQLQRIAVSRGAVGLAVAVPEQITVSLGSAPRRSRIKSVVGETAADQLRIALDPLLKTDQADAAEVLMLQSAALLSPEARAEAAQRVAWSFYSLGRDADAIRVAEAGRSGITGDWSVAAAWVSGLASWRQGDCTSASTRFAEVAGGARETELIAAANYWGARAAQSCRKPNEVEVRLRAAARSPESFYGLIARETLGMTTRLAPVTNGVDTDNVERLPNVRRAIALAGIGERSLAEEALRHQARIGRPSDQRALLAVAQRLDLTAAQYWLASNGQPGAAIQPALRYPRPNWTPQNGWRIDPALALGHVIQESSFRADAVSPAGAVGLLQVRPGTAGDTARARGQAFDAASLTQPAVNLDYGQSFIEQLRLAGATRGQLPRVIAAYNAGPVPVDRWSTINDRGDPLLWIESIPYWETRYYVPAVMRNMWVYQGLAGADQPSLAAIAEHKWPAFPSR